MSLPKKDSDLHNWLNNSAYDNENSALATVRDGIFSIEVLVLVQDVNGMLEVLPWQTGGGKYLPNNCPPDDDCKLIAQQKLRLPARFCYDIDRTVRELEEMDKYLTGFQKSHWLKGQLVLLLDKSLSTELCGFKVKYSQDNGLTYRKEDEV